MSGCCGGGSDSAGLTNALANLPTVAQSPEALPLFSLPKGVQLGKVLGSTISELEPSFVSQQLHENGALPVENPRGLVFRVVQP